MDIWHKETTLGTTGSRCTIRDGSGLFVAECTASDAATIAAAPAMLAALQEAYAWLVAILGDCVRDAPVDERATLERIESAIAAATGNPIPSAPTVGD